MLPSFGTWHDLEDTHEAPRSPGVVQVKLARGLFDYPAGRSAMLLYAACEDIAAWLDGSRDRIDAAARDAGLEGPLRVRWALTGRGAERCGQLLVRFSSRFGAPPRLHGLSPRETGD